MEASIDDNGPNWWHSTVSLPDTQVCSRQFKINLAQTELFCIHTKSDLLQDFSITLDNIDDLISWHW